MPTLVQRIIIDVPLWAKIQKQETLELLVFESEPEFIMQGIAGEIISALKAVTKRADDLIYLCDANNGEPCIGVSVGSANTGGQITYIVAGDITDPSLVSRNWERGRTVWVSNNGELFIGFPTGNWAIKAGEVVDSDTIIVRPQVPIQI